MLIIVSAFINTESPPIIPALIIICVLRWCWKKYRRLNNTANRKEEQTEGRMPTIDDSTAKPLQYEQTPPPESERITERQAAALLSASNNFYIYNHRSESMYKNKNNTFNARTLYSLVNQRLLKSDGDQYYLTLTGYRILRKMRYSPGLAWHPPPFGSIQIKYKDKDGIITERLVDIYRWNRHHIYAYCHLRNRDRRTFSTSNILSAIDTNTGEYINDVIAWLKIHGINEKKNLRKTNNHH